MSTNKTGFNNHNVYLRFYIFIPHAPGDIGGSMGLLIGMSIMSLVEFVDFVLVALWNKCFKHHRT